MPACASAMTAAQSTAARSAGVRAVPARYRALYACASFTNSATVSVVDEGIQFASIVHCDPPPPAEHALAYAIAESSAASDALVTSGYPASAPGSSASVFEVMIAV